MKSRHRSAKASAGVLAFDILDGQVHAIRSMASPDKLQHLGTTSDAFLKGDR